MKVTAAFFLIFIFGLSSASLGSSTLYQKAELSFPDRSNPGKKMTAIVLLEDLGIQQDTWRRNLTIKQIGGQATLLKLRYVYKATKAPGKFIENLEGGSTSIVGEATLLGRSDAWVEMRVSRKNLCAQGAFPKQDKTSKKCDLEQQLVCTNYLEGMNCTETFLQGSKKVSISEKMNYKNIDKKSFDLEIAKLSTP